MCLPRAALLLSVIFAIPCAVAGTAQEQTATRQAEPSAALAAADLAFHEGYAASQRGDLPAARQAFEKAVKLAPEIAAAHGALGGVLLALGDSADALRELELAQRLDRNDTSTLLNLCIAYTNSNDYLKAIAVYRDLEAAAPPGQTAPDPLPPDAAVAVATALSATNATVESQAVLERALAALAAQGQDDARLEDALGTLLAQRKSYGEAVVHLRRALALDRTLAAAHYHLAEVDMVAGSPAEALPELGLAHSLEPASLVYTLELARVLTANSQEPEAIDLLRAAMMQYEDGTAQAIQLKYRLALALQSSGNAKDALPVFDEVLKARPDEAEVLTNTGLAHVQLGDAKGGVPIYLRALKLRPSDPTLREDLGVAYLQQADLDHALEQFRAGLAIDSDNPQLHYDLGLALKLKDDLTAAIPEFQRAATLDPQLSDPPYTLGIIYMQQGKFQEAAASLETATALRPNNGDAWAILGSVYQQMQQPAKAIPALRRAIALMPDQPSPHINLAAILAAQGKKDEAAAERKTGAALTRATVNRQKAKFGLDSGNLLMQRGQTEEALAQFQSAVEADPGYAATHLALATALDRAGRKAEAAEQRRKAAELSSTPPATPKE